MFYKCLGWVLKLVKTIDKTFSDMQLLMSNHIPHLSQDISDQSKTIGQLNTNVVGLTVRVEEQSKRLDDLSGFIRK